MSIPEIPAQPHLHSKRKSSGTSDEISVYGFHQTKSLPCLSYTDHSSWLQLGLLTPGSPPPSNWCAPSLRVEYNASKPGLLGDWPYCGDCEIFSSRAIEALRPLLEPHCIFLPIRLDFCATASHSRLDYHRPISECPVADSQGDFFLVHTLTRAEAFDEDETIVGGLATLRAAFRPAALTNLPIFVGNPFLRVYVTSIFVQEAKRNALSLRRLNRVWSSNTGGKWTCRAQDLDKHWAHRITLREAKLRAAEIGKSYCWSYENDKTNDK